MANGEKKSDVAKALIAHTLNLTADCVATKAARGIQMRMRNIGDFGAAHHVLAGEREIVDVWNGNKVFSATRYLDRQDWELINFKRGEWESGFLSAA